MGGNRGPAPARPYDVLYDPLYTVCGARDHYRQQAQTAGYSIEKVPNFPNFFSDVPTFPSASIRLKPSNDVPAFVPREFRPEHPAAHELQERSTSGNVSGANLMKFLHQPMLTNDDVSQNRALSTVKFATPVRGGSPKSRAESRQTASGPKSVTVGTQSDYRESEAQTVPYTPDYVIPEGAPEPEILGLQELTYGSGLPAGAAAVALVDRMRLRREFEETLPPLNGTEQELTVRKRMMEAWERQEWADREADIAQAQEDRLSAMVAGIEQREAEREHEIRRKIEGLKATKDVERSKALAAIQKRRIQTMRKLTLARTHVEKGTTKRDIVGDYADFGSRVYAPITRAGAALSGQRTVEIDSRITEPGSLPGVAHLEQSLSRKTLPRVTSPQAATKKQSLIDTRQQATARAQLTHIDSLLQTSKTMSNGMRGMGDAWPCPLDANEEAMRLTKTRARARAPSTLKLRKKPSSRVVFVAETEEQRFKRKRRRAVVFLQSLIRGRAAQAVMFETRARLQALAAELQIAAPQTGGDLSPTIANGSVTLETLSEKKLGAVLGDMLSALAIEDVAERQAKLQSIQAEHVANQARIAREEQEALEQSLRKASLPAEDTPFDEEKENRTEGTEAPLKKLGKEHRNNKHRKHRHQREEDGHKQSEDEHTEVEEGDKQLEGGYRPRKDGHKGRSHGHKHGNRSHKHRDYSQKVEEGESDNSLTEGVCGRDAREQDADVAEFEGGLPQSDVTRSRVSVTKKTRFAVDQVAAEEDSDSFRMNSDGMETAHDVTGHVTSAEKHTGGAASTRGKARCQPGKGNLAGYAEERKSDGEEEVSGSGSDSGSWTEGEESGTEGSEGSVSDGDDATDGTGQRRSDGAPVDEQGRAGRTKPRLRQRSEWAVVDSALGDAAATRIQANFRGHQDRVLVARMRGGTEAQY